MNSAELLTDAFGRVRESVHGAVGGLTAERLAATLDERANSIAWLVWHLTRIQDDHVSDVSGLEQVWTAGGWADRFDLPFHPSDTGYGHRPDDVASVRVDADALIGYHDAAHEQTVGYVRGLSDADLDRVVDQAWTPAVTLGTRLVSVIGDGLQHAGQAAFTRGVLERRS